MYCCIWRFGQSAFNVTLATTIWAKCVLCHFGNQTLQLVLGHHSLKYKIDPFISKEKGTVSSSAWCSQIPNKNQIWTLVHIPYCICLYIINKHHLFIWTMNKPNLFKYKCSIRLVKFSRHILFFHARISNVGIFIHGFIEGFFWV